VTGLTADLAERPVKKFKLCLTFPRRGIAVCSLPGQAATPDRLWRALGQIKQENAAAIEKIPVTRQTGYSWQ
jgi:hypothetical protein